MDNPDPEKIVRDAIRDSQPPPDPMEEVRRWGNWLIGFLVVGFVIVVGLVMLLGGLCFSTFKGLG